MVKSRDTLITQFPDNTTRQITAEDSRDVINAVVCQPAPIDGQIKIFSLANDRWEPLDHRLGNLNDVDISGVTNGQVLAYNSGSGLWEPSTDAGDSHVDIAQDSVTQVVDADKIDFRQGLTVTAAGSSNDGIINVDIEKEEAATVASGDFLMISDIDDNSQIKKVTAQSIADLATGETDTHADLAEDSVTQVEDVDKIDFRQGLSVTASGSSNDGVINVDIEKEEAGAVAGGDFVMISDIDDNSQIKKVTAQSIADLAPTGSITIEEDDSSVVGGATNVNFTNGLGVTDAGGNQADVTVDVMKESLVAAAAGDHILIADADDSDNIKRVTAQSIGDLGGTDTHADLAEDSVTQVADVDKIDFRQGLSVTASGSSNDGVINVDIDKEESTTVDGSDLLLVADADDNNNLKKVTAQSIGDLGGTDTHADVWDDGVSVIADPDAFDFREGIHVVANGSANNAHIFIDINAEVAATVAGTDEILIADADDGFNLKKVTASSIGELGGGAFTADGSFAAYQGTDVDAGAGSNIGSLAQGSYATASGDRGSFAQGMYATSSGYGGAFAQGTNVTSSGSKGSFAQGEDCVASGNYGSFAQGDYTESSGSRGSFAQGDSCSAEGNFGSFSQGYATSALAGADTDLTGNSVNDTTEVVTLSSHGLETGDVVVFDTTGGGVTANQVYFVNRIDANDFSLHSSFSSAVADSSRQNLTGNLSGNMNATAALFAQGASVTAAGTAGFAQGIGATAAAGHGAFAQGLSATANGPDGCFAQGRLVEAPYSGSFAQGLNASAHGSYGSFAQGVGVTTYGSHGSFAQGTSVTVTATGTNGCFAQGRVVTVSGYHGCFAQGYNVTASGHGGCFMQGYNALASGYYGAFSHGNATTASGDLGSFAQGNGATSSGDWGSFAQGFQCTSSGTKGSFSQGHYVVASGSVGSIAQGSYATASGHHGSFAQGIRAKALITAAVDATGNTVATGTDLVTLTSHGFVTGEAVVFAATGGGVTAGVVYYLNRDGNNTFSIHSTFADAIADTSRVNLTADLADDDIFRVGGTFAEGASCTASEVASFAQGVGATASGRDGSFAQGVNVTASGAFSFAQGRNNSATAAFSFVQGSNVEASTSGFAQGINISASGGDGVFAQGNTTSASGRAGSFAQGERATASGSAGSFAQGSYSRADGVHGSFAQGFYVTASGDYGSFMQGAGTALGSYGCFGQGHSIFTNAHAGSFAQGINTQARITTAVDATGNTGNTGPDTVTLTTHGFNTGEAVVFAASGGGVNAGVVYYLDRIDANTFSVHSTFAAAVGAGAHVTITGNLASDDIFRVGGTFAEGATCSSSEVASFTQGVGATASGRNGSFSQGVNITASGNNGSFAQGFGATAGGVYGSFAQGSNVTASANQGSFAQGRDSTSTGSTNFAQGSNAKATGFTGGFAQGSTVLASGNNGCFVQGLSSTASGYGGAFAQGVSVTASGSYGCFAQGTNVTASDVGAWAVGERAVADKTGQFSRASGRFSADGDAQYSFLVAREQTTNSTQTELLLDGTTATERITIPTDKSWLFIAYVVGRRTGGAAGGGAVGDTCTYKIEGQVKNVSDTVTLDGSTIHTLQEDDTAWSVDAAADDTNDALLIRVTGDTDKNINWVARVDLIEVA